MAQTPIGFLLVKFQDSNVEPVSKAFAQQMFTAAGRGTLNLVDWFDDNTHGNVDMTGNVVFDWLRLDQKSTDYQGSGANPAGRQQIFDWARHSAASAGLDLSPFKAIVVVTNVPVDLFGSVGNVCCGAPGGVAPSVLCQEMIHGLSVYEHSRQDGSDADYQDRFDVMSLANAMWGQQPGNPSVPIGPGLNAAFMDRCGWLDSSRATSGQQVTLRPLHRRDLPGPLHAVVGPYYVEYRPAERWDSGFGSSVVLVHYRAKHTSYLVKDLTAGRNWFLGNPAAPIATITVNAIDDAAHQATISMQIRVLMPIWIGSGQVPGAGMHWSRGAADQFVAGDINDDGRQEFLAVNNDNGYLGLLVWTGVRLAPTWIGSGRIPGAGGMHWSRDGADQFVAVDADGDGRHEFLVANNNNSYLGLLQWTGTALAPIWIGSGGIPGAGGMHWSRGADQFFPANVDGDPLQELLVVNNTNGYLGLLKWTGAALAPFWIGSGRIQGNGMHWSRAADDRFVVADIDGHLRTQEILVINNSNGYLGLLKWTGGVLAPIWLGVGRIEGNGMHWSRGTHDLFVAADVDGDGLTEILVANNDNGFIGLLKWNGTALAPVWIDVGRLEGIGMHWSRDGVDSFLAADVDSDGQKEILIANNTNGYLGVLKWNGSKLAPVWVGAGRLEGKGMHWSRGTEDLFVAAHTDMDTDRQEEILVANNRNDYLGLLRLTPLL
jgi:hypothetical protein